MGNAVSVIDNGDIIRRSEAKNYLRRRIEGYGETEEKAIEDLNRKCIKKGYPQIRLRENETRSFYYGGKVIIGNEKLYNKVWFKTRNNVNVAYIFVSY